MYPINIDASFLHQKSWTQAYNLALISAMGFLVDFRAAMRRVGGVRITSVFLVLRGRRGVMHCHTLGPKARPL
jgi:hypothetical protein